MRISKLPRLSLRPPRHLRDGMDGIVLKLMSHQQWDRRLVHEILGYSTK
jgi:hypothetical protein